MWDKLCDTFAARCTEFNGEGTGTTLTAKRQGDNTLDVVREAEPPMKTTLVFDPQRYVIRVRGLYAPANAQSQIEIKPKGGSELGFFNSKDSTLITAEKIAEHCLQNLLGLG
jgi:hypothetical protein